MRAMLPLLLVLLAGCGAGGAASTQPATPTAGVATAASPSATLTKPEQDYLAQLDNANNPAIVGVGGARLIQLGYDACSTLNANASDAPFAVQAVQARGLVDAASAETIVRTAAATLCPVASVAALDSPSPGTNTASQPAPEPAPEPALTTVSDGTYEVGTGAGQVSPGKYKSSGPDGGTVCYYARLRNNDGSTGDIIANNLSQGPSIMIVKASDGYVQVNGCTFTKS